MVFYDLDKSFIIKYITKPTYGKIPHDIDGEFPKKVFPNGTFKIPVIGKIPHF